MATHKVLKYFVVAITLCSTCVSEGAIAFQVGLTDKLNAPLSANLDMRKFNQEVMQSIQQQVDYKFKQEGCSKTLKQITDELKELAAKLNTTVQNRDDTRRMHVVKADCSPPFEKIGQSCYFISSSNVVNGDEAFAECLRLGGYLANLETIEEAMLIKSVIIKMSSVRKFHYYIGGRNIDRYSPEGDWRWIRNGEMTKLTYYAAFGPGEPNGNFGSPQDCLFLYSNDNYNMHSVFCYGSNYLGRYICEK